MCVPHHTTKYLLWLQTIQSGCSATLEHAILLTTFQCSVCNVEADIFNEGHEMMCLYVSLDDHLMLCVPQGVHQQSEEKVLAIIRTHWKWCCHREDTQRGGKGGVSVPIGWSLPRSRGKNTFLYCIFYQTWKSDTSAVTLLISCCLKQREVWFVRSASLYRCPGANPSISHLIVLQL